MHLPARRWSTSPATTLRVRLFCPRIAAPCPPSSSRICTWWCAVCCALSPVRNAGLRCDEGVEPLALPSVHQERPGFARRSGACARLRDNYLRHLGWSVQQLYLPVDALYLNIKLTNLARQIIGLGA